MKYFMAVKKAFIKSSCIRFLNIYIIFIAIIPKGLDQTQKETKQSKQPKKVKLEEKLSNLISLIDHIYILEQELLPSQT